MGIGRITTSEKLPREEFYEDDLNVNVSKSGLWRRIAIYFFLNSLVAEA